MFKRILFSQFYDLKKHGKDPLKARTGALLLMAILLALLLVDSYLLYIQVYSESLPVIRTAFSGKLIGKLVGLVFVGIVVGLSYLGLGKKKVEKYWKEFEQLDEYTQQEEHKKGLVLFIVPLFILLGGLIAFIV